MTNVLSFDFETLSKKYSLTTVYTFDINLFAPRIVAFDKTSSFEIAHIGFSTFITSPYAFVPIFFSGTFKLEWI